MMLSKKNEEIWQKVKFLGIFKNYSEFLKLSKKYNGVFVWRKYPSEEWSKDNVFIGTQEELMIWYKTNKEVPFFYNKYIGKKYGHLRVESFEIKLMNNKKIVYANCLCDCGNHCTKKFKYLRENKVTTCGCRSKFEKSVLQVYPNIVNNYWNFEKNKELPSDVSYLSDKKYWWKGYNEDYLISPIDLKQKKSGGTSFPEQAIFFFLSQYFQNVKNRAKINSNGKKYELDIFLPSEKIAIEYDGVEFHKNKVEKEKEKNMATFNNKIFLIRVREFGLPDIDLENGLEIKCDMDNYDYYTALANSINEIFKIIYNKTNYHNIKELKIKRDDIIKNKFNIMSQYIFNFREDSILFSWLNLFWSGTNLIEPYKISINSKEKMEFTCSNKEIITISPSSIINVYNKLYDSEKSIFEKNLIYMKNNEKYCPFSNTHYCPCNCLYNQNPSNSCSIFESNQKNTIYSIPYNETEKEFVKSYTNISKLGITNETIKEFKEKLHDIIQYKIVCKDKAICDFFYFEGLSIKEKIKVINKCLSWPTFDYHNIVNFFENEEILKLYFINYDYDSLITMPNIDLNLFHEHIIYDILKAFVYLKKFEVLINSFNVIKKAIGNNKFDEILCNLTYQILLKSSNNFLKLFTKKNDFRTFSNIVELFLNKNIEKIKWLTNELINADDIEKKQFNIQYEFFYKYLMERVENNDYDINLFISIALKFKKEELFAKLIKNILLNEYRNKEIPKKLIDIINNISYNYNYNLLANIEDNSNVFLYNALQKEWILDFTDILDISVIEKYLHQGLLLKINYQKILDLNKLDIIDEYINIIIDNKKYIYNYICEQDFNILISAIKSKSTKQKLRKYRKEIWC